MSTVLPPATYRVIIEEYAEQLDRRWQRGHVRLERALALLHKFDQWERQNAKVYRMAQSATKSTQ